MNTYAILTPKEVNWVQYRNLRLEALQLEPAAFGSSYEDQKNDTDEEWRDRLSRYILGKGNWMFFAGNENEVIGMAGAFQNEEDQRTDQAQVIAVYVSKEHRGKGLAKEMTSRLLSQLKFYGINKAILYVNVEQEAAVALYKSLGFIVAGKERNRLGDGLEHDEYLMQKTL